MLVPRVLVFPVCVALSACATPETRRAQEPDVIFETSRPASEVADCIAAQWDETAWAPVTRRHSEGRETVFRHDEWTYGVIFLADVDPTDTGSRVQYFDQVFFGREKVRAGLMACADQSSG
jgi:hypothetical protein